MAYFLATYHGVGSGFLRANKSRPATDAASD